MFYEVIQLHRDGQPLRFQEWAAPEFGYVTMSTWRPGKTSLHRTARVAMLCESTVMSRRMIMMLIEPKLMYTPLDGEVWVGTEVRQTDEGQQEIPQSWLVRPRGKDAQPLRPFDVKRWIEMRRASGDVPDEGVGKGWLKPKSRSGNSSRIR